MPSPQKLSRRSPLIRSSFPSILISISPDLPPPRSTFPSQPSLVRYTSAAGFQSRPDGRRRESSPPPLKNRSNDPDIASQEGPQLLLRSEEHTSELQSH